MASGTLYKDLLLSSSDFGNDLNNVSRTSFCSFPNTASNKPTGQACVCLTLITTSDFKLQIAFTPKSVSTKLYYRFNWSGWTDWYAVAVS